MTGDFNATTQAIASNGNRASNGTNASASGSASGSASRALMRFSDELITTATRGVAGPALLTNVPTITSTLGLAAASGVSSVAGSASSLCVSAAGLILAALVAAIAA